MAIGRPIELTPNIATKNISSLATADQTQFTVTGGYRINEIAVYRNGVRLAEGRDFTASDGDTVNLVTAATVDDVIEFAVFDSFNVSDAIVSAASSQNLNGDFNVTGSLYAGAFEPGQIIAGIVTSSTAFHVGSALTSNAAGDVETIGIITASSFSGDGTGLSGVVGVGTLNVRTESLTVSGVSTFTGAVDSNATTDSTSSTTGAITAAGGVGVAKDLFVGDAIDVTKDLKVGAAATITGALTGSTGTFSGAVSGTTGTFSAAVSGTTGTFSGAVNVDATTDSTSTSTGALIVDGGLAVAKNVFIGAGLSVAGTLTYQDVSEIDSVGIVTAQKGVNITGGQLTIGTGITMGIAGVATFSGTSDVHLLDNVQLNVGDSSDLQVFHNGNANIYNQTGELRIRGGGDGTVRLMNAAGNEHCLIAEQNAAVTAYYDNSKKWETTNDGTVTTGISTVTGVIDAQGYINLAQKIIHTGDTDTSFEFDTNIIKFDTAGVEGMRIGGSDAVVAIGTNKTSGSGARLRIGSNLLSLTQDMSDGGMTVVPRTGDTIATDQVMPLITAAGEGASPNILRAGIAVISKSGRSAMDMVFCTRYAADGTALDVTDDETMRLTSDNRVCIGNTESRNIGNITAKVQIEGTDSGASLSITRNSNNSSSPYISLAKTRGTSDGSDVAINDGDGVGTILFSGADGTDITNNAASIASFIDGSPGGNDTPGRLVLSTTADGGTSATERLRIDKTGSFIWSNGAFVEKCNITAGKLSDNTNIDLQDGMVHYFTTQESTTSTPNIRVSSAQSLNDKMTAGDVVTVTLVTTAAAGGYSANVTIDGQGVTEEWVGGSAPSAGGSNGLDIYCYTIICIHASNTGDSGFKVIANLTNAT